MSLDLSLPERPAPEPDGDPPLVSVTMASYEYEPAFMKRAIESVGNQTYENVELVIADSSADETLEDAVESVAWIRYVPSEPRGVAAGYNEAIEAARGEFVSILADDDWYLPERIETQMPRLRDGVDVLFSDVYDVYGDGSKQYRESIGIDDPETFYVEFFRFDGVTGSVPASTVIVRAECLSEHRFDEDLRGGEDYELWVRLFEAYRPGRIAEPLAGMRQHDDSLSSNPDLMFENRLQAIEKLATRYPAIAEYADERRRLERYSYGRELLKDGRPSEARPVLWALAREEGNVRAAVMLGVSLAPCCHRQLVGWLDRLNAALS
jgi:glycosyltransferase involved in cell wall biosynthesis